MRHRPAALLALIASAGALICARPAASSDGSGLLIVNGRIFGHPGADSVLLRGDRIAGVGAQSALRKDLPPSVQVVDAEGGLVLPGFHDAHCHLLSGGLSEIRLKLDPKAKLPDILEAVRAYAAAHPGQDWILGRGWSYDIVPAGALPSRQALDSAAPGRPIALRSYDGHSLWANSKALALAGIGPGTPDPKDGRIAREADGRAPEGTLLEGAATLLKIPEPSRELRLQALETGLQYFLRLGFTSIMDMALDLGAPELDLLEELRRQGKLPLRVTVALPLDGDLALYEKLRDRYQGPFLRFGLLKAFVDGVIESKTAYMLEPYENSKTRGQPRIPEPALKELVRKAHEKGFPVALHAIGDGGVRLALDAFEEAARRYPDIRLRHRVEHIEVIAPQDLARFKALGVVASMQPFHANPDGPDPDSGVWSKNLGAKRLKSTFPWKDLLSNGAVLAFGSDWPVMSADPLWGLAVAATRRDQNGEPKAGWNVHQAIAAEEAVRAYTYGSAYAVGREKELGKIEPGYLADLVVLDPAESLDQPQNLWKGHVRRVIVDGQIRFTR